MARPTEAQRASVPFPPYRAKRALDIVVLVLAVVPAACIGLCCAIAVKVTSRGPVLFRQRRVGMAGVEFEMLKFRTMTVGENPMIPDADRITSAGHWLRRLSLDELPQLVNVARGEMSIVGPRPTLAYQVERYDDRQRGRLSVPPGLTGLAQVRGRNRLRWSDRIEFDLEYVENQSLGTDLMLLVRTVGTVLGGSGVEGHPVDDPIVAVSDDAAAVSDEPPDGDVAG